MTKLSRLMLAVVGLLLISTLSGAFYFFNTNMKIKEQDALASLNHGIELFHDEKYAESLSILTSIPEGVIKEWHLPYYIATNQVMLKDYESASIELEKALSLSPKEPTILFELGVVYFKLGKLALSKSYFALVIEVDPANEEAKGLMDIMANLERIQPGADPEETSQESDSGDDDH